MATTEKTATTTDAMAYEANRERVTFPDLVRIHYAWRHSRAIDSTATEAEREALHSEYHAALKLFEEEHGELVSAYWCAHVESAVALTAGKPNTGWLRRLLSVAPKFHRVSDWATRDEPEIARALHDCDELAVRASEVLRGRSRRITIQLVMTAACHLLSLVDATQDGRRDHASHKAAVASELRGLADLRRDYRAAANGDAQLVYFAGMTIGFFFLALVYFSSQGVLQADGVEERTIIGCAIAGAIGACVSVIARVNSGTFALDFDVARGYTLFLGALRPVIGSVFGLLAYFMLTSEFVQFLAVPDSGDFERFYFLCVVAFGAGFSERWAQDTLTGGLTGRGKARDDAVVKGAHGDRSRKPAAPGTDQSKDA